MGGMICRLMITDAGDRIWRDFFATPPARTPLANDTRKLLEKALVFDHRPDIQRVIFISTPHRGSELASNWIGRIGAALVRTPRLFTSIYASTKPLLIADPAARPLNRMPNSVDTLEPNDRFVEAVEQDFKSLQVFLIIRLLETAAGVTHRTVPMVSFRTGALISRARSRS